MDDIDLLPQALRKQSLSDREIVLPYQEALEALDLLVTANRALLGWEGWVKYPDGHHGPTPEGVMGTTEVEQEEGETWRDYVERSARFCRETMNREQQAWDANPRDARLLLCFCLTAAPPEESSPLHSMEYTLAKQGKASPPVHLSLNELQFGHMPFDHPISDRPALGQLSQPLCLSARQKQMTEVLARPLCAT